MALIKCRECGEPVSTAAVACPKCGAPPKKQKSGDGISSAIAVVIVLVVGYNLIKSNSSDTSPGSTAAATEPAASCKTDWHLCSDNADLINNNSSILGAQIACKSSANDLAKFGSPEWPWLPFGSFYKGDDGVKTGKLRLVEKDAKFQNGFGAMAHVIVNCTYDLTSKSVIDVSVDQP